MVDQRETYVQKTERETGGSYAFILGGLVVAVAIIAWFVWGNASQTVATTPAGDSVVIENNMPATATPDPVVDAPAAETDAPETVTPDANAAGAETPVEPAN